MKSATLRRFVLRPSLATGIACAAMLSACLDDQPTFSGIAGAPNSPGDAGASAEPQAGTGAQSSAGTEATAGGKAGAEATGGSATAQAGTDATMGEGGAVVAEGGSPGHQPNEGGTNANAGSDGGGEDEGGVHIPAACTFHTTARTVEGGGGSGGSGSGGSGGSGGAPVVTGNVVAQVSVFVGSYLTDNAGRTLYTYGADVPGDCSTPPKSNCVADCLVSWPVFDAGPRVLGAGLSDAGFGEIQLGDGSYQTTYMGWPLYYYKSDLTLGQLTGQGKGKTWHVAQVTPPSVVIMKAGTAKYLADVAGHTMYVSAADQPGTSDADPISNCTGSCLDTFEAFHEKKLSIVGSLDSRDFQVFVRHGGGLQLAYKGMPLYRAATDVKAGDMNGTAVTGFTAAVQ